MRLNYGQRMRVYAPVTVDATQKALMTPAAGAPHSDAFQIATVDFLPGYKGYLFQAEGRKGKIDPVTKAKDKGEYTIEIADFHLDPRSPARRWLTAFLGSPTGHNWLLGCTCIIEDTLDVLAPRPRWQVIFSGPITKVDLSDPVKAKIQVQDMVKALDAQIFTSAPNPSANVSVPMVMPIGRTKAWNGLPATPVMNGTWNKDTINSLGLRRILTNAFIPVMGLTQGAEQFVVTNLLSSYVSSSGNKYATDRLKPNLRFEFSGNNNPAMDGKHALLFNGSSLKNSSSSPQTLIDVSIQSLDRTDPYYIDITDHTLYPEGASVKGFIRNWDGAASESYPVLIMPQDPLDILRDVFTGKFGNSGPDPLHVVEFDDSNFSAIRGAMPLPQMSFHITKPEKMGKWVETEILQPCGLGYWVEPGVYADGTPNNRVRIFDMRLDAILPSISSLPVITDADLVLGKEPTWSHNRLDAASVVTCKARAWVDGKLVDMLSGKLPTLKGIAAPDPIEYPIYSVTIDEQAAIGEKRIDLTGNGFNEARTGASTALGAITAAAAKQAVFNYVPAFGYGPMTAQLTVKRTVAAGYMKPGSWCIVNTSYLPNPGTKLRGGSRLMLVTETMQKGTEVVLSVLDYGINSAAAVPTLASLTLDFATRTASVNVTIPTGNKAQFQIAFTPIAQNTAPADSDASWSLVNVGSDYLIQNQSAATTSGVWYMGNISAGNKVWVRARSLSLNTEQTLPSPWSTAVTSTQGSIPVPGALSFTEITDRSILVNWTNANTTDPVVLTYAPANNPTVVSTLTLPPGTTSTRLTALDQYGDTSYIVSISSASSVYGDVSAPVSQTIAINTTPAPTAPTMSGITVTSIDTHTSPTSNDTVGIELSLAPGLPGIPIEIQRADNSVSVPGTPDLTTATSAAILDASYVTANGARFIDSLPLDGLTRFYRARQVGPGYTPGPWTSWVSGVPVVIKVDGTTASLSTLNQGILKVANGGTGLSTVTGYLHGTGGTITAVTQIPASDVTDIYTREQVDAAVAAATPSKWPLPLLDSTGNIVLDSKGELIVVFNAIN